jgi:hypothetical protein
MGRLIGRPGLAAIRGACSDHVSLIGFDLAGVTIETPGTALHFTLFSHWPNLDTSVMNGLNRYNSGTPASHQQQRSFPCRPWGIASARIEAFNAGIVTCI